MVEKNQTDALRCLIETEIPEGRSGLENCYANLERVAAYCEAKYAQATDKKAAFDETTQFTIQSLASVAYQVNLLACALMQALDLQANKVKNMASELHNIGQVIAVHKEKVARREIGVLTVNKTSVKQPKIIAPVNQERYSRYQRMTVDFTIFDGIGHGAKPNEPMKSYASRVTSLVSGGSSGVHYPVFPNYDQLLPKANINATLSRSSTNRSEHYRVPQMAPVPTIDSQRFSTLCQQSLPSVGSASLSSNYGSIRSYREVHSMPLPPPQLASVEQYRFSNCQNTTISENPYTLYDDEPLPSPPPPVTMISPSSVISTIPVNSTLNHFESNIIHSSNQQSGASLSSGYNEQRREWVPKMYIEKAIALYDYEAEKPDELTLKENCIVYVLRKNEDGWYEGVLNGCTGLFPGNYVQAI